jgi:hypothetical protein
MDDIVCKPQFKLSGAFFKYKVDAMDADQLEEVEKLYRKFENDAHDKIKSETDNHRLSESGQPRTFLKNLVTSLVQYGDKRLDAQYQIKLYLMFASDFFEFREFSLALDCFEMVLARCDNVSNELLATKHRVEAMQSIVRSNYGELIQLSNAHISPMVVSKLLVLLKNLRQSLENIFELPVKQQEGLAWQVLNSCKLIMEIGQPLVWYSCGKYVTETIMFGAISMEAVINLCTVRHMKFRMKMYASVFYSALANSVIDEAAAALEHARKQVAELKEREELDPPVPDKSTACIQQSLLDVAVMQFVLDFWRDPDSFSLSDGHLGKYYTAPSADAAKIPAQSFADLCTSECIRVHLLASGNTNEPFRKRSTCLLKGIATALQGFSPIASPSVEEKDGTLQEIDADRTKLYNLLTMRSLLESATLALFCASEGVEVSEVLGKINGLAQEIAVYQVQATDEPGATQPLVQVDHASLDQIALVHQLHRLTENKTPGAGRVKQVLEVVQRYESLVYRDDSYRLRAFLKKVGMELWKLYLCPAIQEVLSDLNMSLTPAGKNGSHGEAVAAAAAVTRAKSPKAKSKKAGDAEVLAGSAQLVRELGPGLLAAVKVLDLTHLDDPVLMGTLALLAAQVQWYLGDHRGSIAVTQHAIYTMDEHRMGRVDALQHIPEDVRDVLALQRASFTTRGDSQDWFHSVKRLGAHAFAGYVLCLHGFLPFMCTSKATFYNCFAL